MLRMRPDVEARAGCTDEAAVLRLRMNVEAEAECRLRMDVEDEAGCFNALDCRK